MDQLMGQLQNLLIWFQKPGIVVYGIMLAFSAYEIWFNGGERGGSIGKKSIIISTVAFVILEAAGVLSTSLGQKINF